MEYAMLGNSGLKVSRLCLGTLTFGDTTPDEDAVKIVHSARDVGVNFMDTADGYAASEAEKRVGKLTKEDRNDWIIATKVGSSTGTEKRKKSLSRKWMMQAIDESLSRLQTDYVDIWYLHHVDWETPIEETVRTIADVISAGKVRHWGFSNHRGWQIGELVHAAAALGAPQPVVAQPYYNAFNRMPETDILPACNYYGIGVVPYSPLARGVLAGIYKPGEAPSPESRAGLKDRRLMQTEWREESLIAAQKIKRYCEKRGMSIITFAIQWLLNNKALTGVLGGPRTFAHWEGYLEAMEGDWTAEDEAFLDSLCPPGQSTTHGYCDPRYPVRGRIRQVD
ncbi:aldo/keto reductase [Alphaproteobacteria bacterium]|nr:aldo/keto reductase [Alphaproteobacteria bacterium]